MERLIRNPQVVCTELEDGAVLLNMESRLYFSLNETGLELWNALDGAAGTEQVADRLTRSFDVDGTAATSAVSRFVPELERERLVVPATEAPEGTAPAGDAPARPTQAERRPFAEPELVKHDEPLHEVSTSPFDPQLPLAE
jgi:hypothetical protein